MRISEVLKSIATASMSIWKWLKLDWQMFIVGNRQKNLTMFHIGRLRKKAGKLVVECGHLGISI